MGSDSKLSTPQVEKVAEQIYINWCTQAALRCQTLHDYLWAGLEALEKTKKSKYRYE